MSKAAWPTVPEVTDRLTGLGVTSIPAGVSLQDEIDAAIGELHKAIGFAPFLASASDGYYYTPPRSTTLLLGGPFFAITEVRTNYSTAYAGDLLTSGDDYWLELPPYGYIAFESRQYGDINSIKVTGQKGVTDDIPVDLWKAVLDRAAGGVLDQSVSLGDVAGPISRIKQGGVDIEFGGKITTMSATMSDRATKVFKSYRRPVLVGASQ